MDVTSGMEIAQWWWEQHQTDFTTVQSADGYDMTIGSYIWMVAYVDMDYQQYFLLEVRTTQGHHETRDYLYVGSGPSGKLECEWHNQPIAFEASPEDHRDRFRRGMRWFADRIELSEE